MQVKRLSITVFSVLFSLLLPSFVHAQGNQPKVVSIPDANLAAAVREIIGDSITTHTLLDLTGLRVEERGIENLTGLEHARNLKRLHLQKNAISDISPLAGLTQLTELLLAMNNISDVSPLANLKQLTYLSLPDNHISDISPLAELKKLTRLALWKNNISDISSLAELKNLTSLNISRNNIRNISPLAELKQLTRLDIGYNNISDISPLVELKKLTGLYISGNPLNYASINTHISAIQAKGIEMDFDERVPRHLVKISDPMEQGMVNSPFPLRFVVEVLDQRRKPFSGVPVTFSITAGDGTLTVADRRTDASGKATARLKLGRTVGSTILRVTAAHIQQTVEFTAMAVLRSKPVYVPDANLRVKIVETLRIPPGETLTVADMLKLRRLTANDANIRDLTGLQLASNLTFLSLANNAISDTAPLAGLPRLTTLVLDDNRISDVVPLARLSQLTLLSLRNNWISDMSPLVSLTQLKGSKNRYGLDLRGNRLTSASIYRYIPLLQVAVAGVNVGFENTLIDQKDPMVRLIYFFPRDRQPQPDINAKIDGLIKDTQKLYADEMQRHGFGRKTFRFETDAHGNAVVYHVKGRFRDQDYNDGKASVSADIHEQLGGSQIDFHVIDVSDYPPFRQRSAFASLFITSTISASTFMPAFGSVFNASIAAHELGHAFGLEHDYRGDGNIMTSGRGDRLSRCAAEWLDVNPHFNPDQATRHGLTYDNTTIEMLPPSLVSPPNTIRLRFKITDPNGIHQVQLRTNGRLTACQNLNGKTNDTVDFTLPSLKRATVIGEGLRVVGVSLMVADVHGFLEYSPFSIDIGSVLPPPQPISIPDPNLAAAIRQKIGDSITTHTLLDLTQLDVPNSGITDLTGLEHAHSLTYLGLRGDNNANNNRVPDFSPLAGLTNLTLDLSQSSLSDVSPLANLKNLTRLILRSNNLSDVAPLAGLTNLTQLELTSNNISDVAPLAGLTNLTQLWLGGNNISDMSPLANLKNLTNLSLTVNNTSDMSLLANFKNLTVLALSGNNISDVSPLAGLTNLTELVLSGNNISDVSPLANLKNLTSLSIQGNISDVAPLANLKKLHGLDIHFNNISDVEPLSNLKNLTYLNLSGNNISDVSPLLAFGPGTASSRMELNLHRNPLSDASINTHIPALLTKGMNVQNSLIAIASAQDIVDPPEKITGPWLWMIAPTHRNQGGAPSIDVDSLAAVSRGAITEVEVAANGASEGDRVGGFVWTPGQISPTEGDINECLNRIGMTTGDVNDHSAYALFSLPSDADRTGVRMSVGSDDAIKVWLNGEVVHKNAVNRPASDFQDTFQVDLKKGENLLLVKVSERAGAWRMFVGIDWVESTQNPDITADVNGDGVVNIQDLVSVASRLGHTGQHVADVNGDGVVNIQDLVLVAGELGGAAAAPSAWHVASAELPSRVRVEQWLAAAYRVPRTDARLQRGIDWLERLLAALPPKETALLTNYPNPFNPETWIPYQLAKPAEVTLRIYAVNGALVRTLALGHQPEGMYHRKSRAAYWDGKNEFGEPVASSVYFYTLKAGDFTATRKMLIRK